MSQPVYTTSFLTNSYIPFKINIIFHLYILQAKTTVKFTPDAFTEPYLYTGTKETEVRVQEFKDYLSGKRVTSPDLKVRKLIIR